MRALQRLRIRRCCSSTRSTAPGAARTACWRRSRAAHAGGHRRWARSTPLGTRGAASARRRAADAGFTARLAEVLAERDDGLLAAYVATRRAFPTPAARPRWRPRRSARSCTRSSSARRSPAQASSTLMAASPSCCRRPPATPDGAGVGHASSRSSAAAAARRSRTSGCSREPSAPATGCGSAPGSDGQGDRDRASSTGDPPCGGTSVTAGADRQALGPGRGPGSATGSGSRRRRDAEHQFPPPTLESVVVAARSRRPGAAAGRAGPARRAGPAHQPAPGRRAAGDLRVALRRGPEGGHPGRRSPTTSASRSRSARPRRSTSSGQLGAGEARRGPACRRRTRTRATVGLRVEPGPAGSGIEFRLDVDPRLGPPLHLQDRGQLQSTP